MNKGKEGSSAVRHHVLACILINCICAGSWKKATELPKGGGCGAFPSFSRNTVAVITSALFFSKQRHSLELGVRFRKAASS